VKAIGVKVLLYKEAVYIGLLLYSDLDVCHKSRYQQ